MCAEEGAVRICLLVLAVLLVAVCAYATDPMQSRASQPIAVQPPAYEFYCQPPHMYLWTINASTGFASEAADDIPDDFYGMDIMDVVCYVSEWGGSWMDPGGVYINFYDAECPPGMSPVSSFYFDWASLEKVVVYDDPGYFTTYRVRAYLPNPMLIGYDMSIGFQVANTWGDMAPYCGVVMTDEGVVFGDCEGYWDGVYWGFPRWTGLDAATGIPIDVAYCLSDGTGGNAGIIFDECYLDGGLSTIYKFFAHAGNAPVNDIEICAFIDGRPADVVACSVPGSWTCHFDPGTNCIYFQTADNPIPPNQTYGLFDIWVDAPYCYAGVTIIWSFTYNGQIVAGPYTTYFECGPSGTEPATWGAIKSLYK